VSKRLCKSLFALYGVKREEVRGEVRERRKKSEINDRERERERERERGKEIERERERERRERERERGERDSTAIPVFILPLSFWLCSVSLFRYFYSSTL